MKKLTLPVVVVICTVLAVWLPGAIASTRSREAVRASSRQARVTRTAWVEVPAIARRAQARAAASGLPAIHHVFTIVLENESASVTFGAGSAAPYLATTLRSEGAYLPEYHGIGHNSLDNYIAMISGQAPNTDTQEDCQLFQNLVPGTIGADGQAQGLGCVYPNTVPTISSQLTQAGLTWRSYNDSMGATPTREAAECGHPSVGTKDDTQSQTADDQYATRHDPFVYFHSIIDDTALCDSHVVNLDQLPNDLASASTTPNYVFITPGLCDDGHDTSCPNGDPGGLTQVNTFLQEWVPKILSSPAFTQQNGLLMIIFDEASTSDSSSCCGEIPGPGPSTPGAGGGDTGAVLLSPCIKPGTVTQTPYNHYTMLRSVEDLFGLSHIGYAGLSGETSFGSDIFTGKCSQAPSEKLVVHRGKRSGDYRQLAVSWSPIGTAASTYTIRVRQLGAHPTAWKVLALATTKRSLLYRAKIGHAYQFSVSGTNATGTGPSALRTVRLSFPPHH